MKNKKKLRFLPAALIGGTLSAAGNVKGEAK